MAKQPITKIMDPDFTLSVIPDLPVINVSDVSMITDQLS